MITAYALTAGLRHLPPAPGIDGAPVQSLRHRALAVVVSHHRSPSPPSRSRDAVLAHAGVCEGLMATAEAVLPVRFGAVFDDERALRASLDDRHDRLVSGLEHVRHRVEIGVRVLWDEPGAPPPRPSPVRDDGAGGRAYLMARVAQERRRTARRARAEAVAGPLHRAFAEQAVDDRLDVLPTGGLVMSAAYLVGREAADRLVARVQGVARDHPDLDVLCTGPWPPYNFAEGEEIHAR